MVLPRTPYTKNNGPSGAEVVQGGANTIGVEDIYQGVAYVAGGVFNFASGIVAGYQAGPVGKPAVPGKGKEQQQQKHRERDISRDDRSLSDFGNDFNEPYDKAEHERLVQRALAAFRKAEARGDTEAEITEEEYAAYKLQVVIDERLKREDEQRQRELEERRRQEAGKRKVTVPVPSSSRAPGIYVEGQGFTPIGAYPSSSNSRSGSTTSLPASFPEAPYSDPTFTRSINDVSSIRSMDSGRSSSSYISSQNPVTARRPIPTESSASLNDFSGAPRSRSPGGSSIRSTSTARNVGEGPVPPRKGWLGW
ncbi:hypothetical protein DFH27DRAFT_538471 [Peziza echinospora]|nr:hypothetical protein DFH27DRAFT_538471 [Peziza echinospora]